MHRVINLYTNVYRKEGIHFVCCKDCVDQSCLKGYVKQNLLKANYRVKERCGLNMLADSAIKNYSKRIIVRDNNLLDDIELTEPFNPARGSIEVDSATAMFEQLRKVVKKKCMKL